MDTKRLAVGTVTGTVVLFVLGYVIFEVLLGSTYMENSAGMPMRAEPDLLLITLSTVVFAFFLTWVLVKWANAGTLATGATVGAFVGFVVTLAWDLGMAGMMADFPMSMLVIDPIASAVWSALGGAAIGAALAKTATTPAAPAPPPSGTPQYGGLGE